MLSIIRNLSLNVSVICLLLLRLLRYQAPIFCDRRISQRRQITVKFALLHEPPLDSGNLKLITQRNPKLKIPNGLPQIGQTPLDSASASIMSSTVIWPGTPNFRARRFADWARLRMLASSAKIIVLVEQANLPSC
jgi:hypothetical protein